VPERFTSAPLELPGHEPDADFVRAELQFQGVDHSGLSYEARIFLNQPDADADTPREPAAETGYVGSFHIFGHGGCFGDVGHCDVPSGPRHADDLRLPHPLTPDTKLVVITEALRRLRDEGAADVTITVVAHVYDPAGLPLGRDMAEPLLFDSVRLVTYESPPAGPAPARENERAARR
jgi:tyrosinase